MIISASRRTDIPAFYSDWFFRRLEAGYLRVANPMNRKMVSEIALNHDTVDCFVFWTKNPGLMLSKLHLLEEKNYKYYFQFTLTPYGADVEPNLGNKNEIIKTFRELSSRIGRERVIWRYDPILLSPKYTKEFHGEWFEKICRCLAGYTDTCVISYLDLYAKIKRRMQSLEAREMSEEDMRAVAKRLAGTAADYGMTLQTCSEAIDLSVFGIQKGGCIDRRRIEAILGEPVDVKKEDTQRENCGCAKSIDIGQYNTCRHFCAYCYANDGDRQVEENLRDYDAGSELLAGRLRGDETIRVREMKSLRSSTTK